MGSEMCIRDRLHDEHREDWALWCEAVGLEADHARRGPVFIDSNGVMEAALAGMGMALLRRSFIAPALAQGRLVNPLAQPIACPLAYYLVYHETALLAPANRCFRDWLLAMAEKGRNEGTPLSGKDGQVRECPGE